MTLWLDIFERVMVALLFCLMLCLASEDFQHGDNHELIVFVMVELVIVAFVLGRPLNAEMSVAPRDWALACFGTCLPLLAIPSAGQPLLPIAVCVPLMLAGMVCQISGKYSLVPPKIGHSAPIREPLHGI